jgi:threonyl-tRNA synthetase
MLVLGRKEVEEGTVSVRSRKKGNEGSMPADAFVEKVVAEVTART